MLNLEPEELYESEESIKTDTQTEPKKAAPVEAEPKMFVPQQTVHTKGDPLEEEPKKVELQDAEPKIVEIQETHHQSAKPEF